MRKNIWILNHYATAMGFEQGGRHYWFAQNLINNGYSPIIFCANILHNSDQVINLKNKSYSCSDEHGVSFVYVKTSKYNGNGLSRIQNMVSFYRNLINISEEFSRIYGKPDLILASSVHPLTLKAGIKIAKAFGIPCICEIRDLWPASLVEYGYLKEDSLITRGLYETEKNIYKQADRLIFTMAGGKDYINDKKWDKGHGGPIDLDRVFHINNGVNNVDFKENILNHPIEDADLENPDLFKVIYSGSIRKVNQVEKIIDIARYLNEQGITDIRFLLYGSGDEKASLETYCRKNGISNVVFKGLVPKNTIPYILSKSDLNILHFKQSKLKKYGASLNKLFEYFASGKPVLSDCQFGYDLVQEYDCGIVIDNGSSKEMAEAILNIKNMPKEGYAKMCSNSLRAADEYDFVKLTKKLIEIIGDI